MTKSYNGCKCFCHYGHNIMHCFPCCGPGSTRSDVIRPENRDLNNPRLEALGYEWKCQDGEVILVKVKMTYQEFKKNWYENLCEEIQQDRKSMFALDIESELECLCKEEFGKQLTVKENYVA